MIKADLHVHSRASKRPSEWFLKKVGASECYTDIDTLYALAKSCGMDFVTVTDHNTIEGALELVEKYPDDTFISVETTTYFPENNCKIHILLFDITPDQFLEIESVRHDVYQLRNLIQAKDLAYSVAHGFYSVNRRLDMETLEKLMLLFDVFEGLNGARNLYGNETWQDILKNLTPGHLERLGKKYGIAPMHSDSWIKGFTGGSDDHAGLFIGRTHTVSDGTLSKSAFIQAVKNRQTFCAGRCNDYKSFALSIYKIFCDFSADAGRNIPGGILSVINQVLFGERQGRLKQWLTLRRVRKGKRIKDKIVLTFFEEVYAWSRQTYLSPEARFARIYESMGRLLDEFFKMALDSLSEDFVNGDIGKVYKTLAASFPAVFISVPFFSSLSHLSRDRVLMTELRRRYRGRKGAARRKVLWFTDTFDDLNEISDTLDRFRQECQKRRFHVTFAACARDGGPPRSDGTDILYLPCMYTRKFWFYDAESLHFPSLLLSMEIIQAQRPDRIIVSTPGPVGILGMMMAHLLGVDCVAVYHTDFAARVDGLFKDAEISGLVRFLMQRFYGLATRIKVPTLEYRRILAEQHYPVDKISLFRRGMSVPSHPWDPCRKKRFLKARNIRPGTTLLWAGRVNGDNHLSFLMTVYLNSLAVIPDLNLILCGDGPDMETLRSEHRSRDRVHFMGRVENEERMGFYESADLLVFPSETDTFAMAVLEAQSRGLPVLVTDTGGPREVVRDKISGYVLPPADPDAWVQTILTHHLMKIERPEEIERMREACRNHVRDNFAWDSALSDILDDSAAEPEALTIRVRERISRFPDAIVREMAGSEVS